MKRSNYLYFISVIVLAISFQMGILSLNQKQFTSQHYQIQYQKGYNACTSSEMDTDGDCVTDRNEMEIFGTDTTKVDTDGDGYSDFQEITACYDPNDKIKRIEFNQADKWRVKAGINPIEGKLLGYYNSNPLGSYNYCKENSFRITKPF